MGLPKGRTNNPAGKPPGALNRITKDLRESITEFLENNFDEVIQDWHNLKDKRDKIQLYRDLLQYAVPRMRTVEMKSEFEKLSDEDLKRVIDELKK